MGQHHRGHDRDRSSQKMPFRAGHVRGDYNAWSGPLNPEGGEAALIGRGLEAEGSEPIHPIYPVTDGGEQIAGLDLGHVDSDAPPPDDGRLARDLGDDHRTPEVQIIWAHQNRRDGRASNRWQDPLSDQLSLSSTAQPIEQRRDEPEKVAVRARGIEQDVERCPVDDEELVRLLDVLARRLEDLESVHVRSTCRTAKAFATARGAFRREPLFGSVDDRFFAHAPWDARRGERSVGNW